MTRPLKYALTAGFLSSGAPAGLLGLRLVTAPDERVTLQHARTELAADTAAYAYVAGAAAITFALFGYMLGRQADRLAELSETDPLTKLLNARGFSSRLRAEIKRSRRYREPLTLMFLDLDGLKDINDRHGHRAGSAALRQVARVIRSELRETDVGARWGGDEFTILAPNTAAAAALALAERIRSRIAAQVAPWPLTASIGLVTAVGDDKKMRTDSASLLRAADKAMYEAKKRGKNAVVAADPPAPLRMTS
jgi:two-component system, cell cycle response regulator